MKSRFLIAFLSLLLIGTIVAPSVCSLIDVDLQTALIDSTEGEKKKEAKEKEAKEKKLISEIALVNLNDLKNLSDANYQIPFENHLILLREVPIPPPELLT